MKWVKVDVPFLEEEFVKQVKVDGKKLCLIRHQTKLFVVQNTCPHAGGILSGGWCKEGNIVCPIHRYEYNLITGRGAKGQGDYIHIYPTEEREDGLYIGFKESLWKRFFS
jgi:nitrite reductase/ring-hydroxylating ferredoxin subunit